LKADIDPCLETGYSILLDFGAVRFVDGSILSLLHDVTDRLTGGWLGIARPLPHIERLFRVAGLTDRVQFRVFSTTEEALESLT
jgi:anti-anti-sigma regulatory factor